jgi:aromatic-L-amino-acid decarboxylase
VIDVPPELSLFAFHLSWPGATLADEDTATRALMARTSARGRVMITGAVTRGRYVGRVCVLSFRTHQAEIDALLHDMTGALHEIRPAL